MHLPVDKASGQKVYLAKKFPLFILLIILLFLPLGCGPKDDNSIESEKTTQLKQASDWFVLQEPRYEILLSGSHGDSYVILAGLKIPEVDGAYYSLKLFVIKNNEESFSVLAKKSGDVAISAGFSASVLSTKDMTIVFGDISKDGVYDFGNDKRIGLELSEAHILLSNGAKEIISISTNRPYMLILDGEANITDIEFYEGDELIAKYTDYFSDNLMADTGSEKPFNEPE